MKGHERPPRQRSPRHPKFLGQRIWVARERLGLTQRALGEEVGVGQAAVSAWEKGTSQPRESLWPLLCKTLAQTRCALETGTGFPVKETEPRVSEGRAPSVVLPRIPKGAETLLLSEKGLAQESMTAAQAAKALREAVKSGRPVWIVVG